MSRLIPQLGRKSHPVHLPASHSHTLNPSHPSTHAKHATRPPHTQHTLAMSAVPALRHTSASPASRKAVKASATASASSSRPPTRSSDPYYGHEETAVMAARFITSLFTCPNIPVAAAPGAPTPTLAHFVAYALHRTRLPSVVTFAALLLLQRLKRRYPAARGSSGHRLFISAFMIASKVICDDTYSNQSWGIVAQKMFALKEVNQMEREMCGYLEWNLNFTEREMLAFEAALRAEHGPRAVARASSGSSGRSEAAGGLYPTPETTPDPVVVSRPIRPVPSPFKSRSFHSSNLSFPSPPLSPQPPHLTSAGSSLQSSPASDDCKTPSPVAVPSARSSMPHGKGYDMGKAFERNGRSHGRRSKHGIVV
nr:alternative cyclin Pcl12 [Cryptococcus depauperatus CBS 7841]